MLRVSSASLSICSYNLLASACFMTWTKYIVTGTVQILICSAPKLMLQMAKWEKTSMNIGDTFQKSNPKKQYFEKVSLWPNISFPLNFWCSAAPPRDLLSSFKWYSSSHMFHLHSCSNYSENTKPEQSMSSSPVKDTGPVFTIKTLILTSNRLGSLILVLKYAIKKQAHKNCKVMNIPALQTQTVMSVLS